jgi:GTP cyclohydrolase II
MDGRLGDESPTRRSPRNYAYNWKDVHEDLAKENYAGVYGWDNAAYWAIAERKAHVDLREFYKRRAPEEFYLPAWKELLDNPETQKHWGGIVTFDPLGMYGSPPTIASCEATLNLPDFEDMTRDGVIVKEDGGVRVSKAAVYYAWNIPHLADRLGLGEQELREALFKYSGQDKLLDPATRTYLPAVGGFTIYAFGDVRKIRDPSTEIAVRVHDECIGSDVFGSDICTCRPYLIFALRHAIECAQRGGVGLVVYFRKEGRSLGEVIKFRVYNARTNQAGGDCPEKYFHHTESIAGIRDARFQTMMPDALSWLGISRIDWLLSMSNEKFEAIRDAGIRVMQRVDLPDAWVPKSAWVELDAKIASGYHSDAIVKKDDIKDRLAQLGTIREQCGKIYEIAQRGHLSHFILAEEKFPIVADYVEQVIRDTYPDLSIPMHSRVRHFKTDILESIASHWPEDKAERCRRLIDLCTVSVLLDAGAGAKWKYICPWDGSVSNRSEGLAQATMDMFADGCFSSDPAVKYRVNSVGLANLKLDTLKRGFQVHGDNVVTGLEGRLGLLHRLGEAMEANGEFFGPMEIFRPGNLIDYLLKNGEKTGECAAAGCPSVRVSVHLLWYAVMKGLVSIWPAQTTTGLRRGDVWIHSKIKNPQEPGSDLVPFHKLSQWLTYSLVDVIESAGLGVKFTDMNDMTALAEYRNGGLLVDLGVLRLRDPRMHTFGVHVGSELVVEWRALTIVLMDKLAAELRKRFNSPDMTLSSILEGGTWRAGRKIAFSLRQDGSPPILVESDGTVF